MIQIILIAFLLGTVAVIVENAAKWQNRKRFSQLIWFVFFVYVLGNLYFTMLSRTPGSGTRLDLRPFKSYFELAGAVSADFENAVGFMVLFLDGTNSLDRLILNILLYYPLGYLLPILFPKLNPKHVILIGCLCSIATEATQYLLKMGWCETDDVIHNTLGTAIGVWVWLWQSKRLNAHDPPPNPCTSPRVS
jgi:glycopeptide antibiotics resistance protein